MRARPAFSSEDIASRISRGEERALARLLSGLEDGEGWALAALRSLRKASDSRNSRDDAERGSTGEPCSPPRAAQIVGVTGPPGSGKSTLVDKMIGIYRARGDRVAVIAVDPSSPFTGGAILGDRIRMQGPSSGARAADDGLFIRSLASRGRLGGLSGASAQCARAFEAAGYGVVIVETVGIGQSEVDIARLADSVVLVSTPGSGDDIQTIKAGVMEIGDVFVVNKADREGADRAVREIRSMLETGADSPMGHHAYAPTGGDVPPVLKTVAETGEGVSELVAALDALWSRLRDSGALFARRQRGALAETRALLSERLLAELKLLEGGLEERLAGEIVSGELDAADAADIIFASIRARGGDGP
jgi:LAO/AO transport system kinase